MDDQQLAEFLDEVLETAKRPEVERTAFLLSFKAGLRVQEIAGLEWKKNMLGPRGAIRMEEFDVIGSKGRVKREKFPVLFVGSDIAKGATRKGGIGKYGKERTLRLHPMLLAALEELREMDLPGPYVIPSGKQGAAQTLQCRAHALRMRLNRIYDRLGYVDCTTHSGRRTFITNGARKAALVGCSLRDIQQMAGHRQLTTTQQYIDTTAQQADLIALI